MCPTINLTFFPFLSHLSIIMSSFLFSFSSIYNSFYLFFLYFPSIHSTYCFVPIHNPSIFLSLIYLSFFSPPSYPSFFFPPPYPYFFPHPILLSLSIYLSCPTSFFLSFYPSLSYLSNFLPICLFFLSIFLSFYFLPHWLFPGTRR